MTRKTASLHPMTRVSIDSRDASRDKMIPLALARAMYERGHLAYDLTNGVYCVNDGTKFFPYIQAMNDAKNSGAPYEVRNV